jgi:hypothetical protein
MNRHDDALIRIRTAINAEIAELRENSDKHSNEVQTNAIMIAEGLRRALRIIEDVQRIMEAKDGIAEEAEEEV